MSETLLEEKTKSEPWYKQGLKFSCTGCGKCCTGEPGYVWVNEEEITQMATFLKIAVNEFAKRYLRKKEGQFALVEMKSNHACIFLKDNQCRVYGARPTQCKTFPFWPENLQSKEHWDKVKERCEGISETAQTIDSSTIDETRLIQINRNLNT